MLCILRILCDLDFDQRSARRSNRTTLTSRRSKAVIDIDELQKKLRIIAEVVNSFKSEAVQLRVVDALIGQLGIHVTPTSGHTDTKKTPKRSRQGRKKPTAPVDVKAGGSRSSRSAGSPGSLAMISELLGSGFFKQPRTIADIVAHCAASRGHHYKANECSPALLRLLRDEKLERQKNKDGQYEYTQT
jgi:hypothetical protein